MKPESPAFNDQLEKSKTPVIRSTPLASTSPCCRSYRLGTDSISELRNYSLCKALAFMARATILSARCGSTRVGKRWSSHWVVVVRTFFTHIRQHKLRSYCSLVRSCASQSIPSMRTILHICIFAVIDGFVIHMHVDGCNLPSSETKRCCFKYSHDSYSPTSICLFIRFVVSFRFRSAAKKLSYALHL